MSAAIQQLTDPRTLYEQPANAFVARFVGENNRLSGTVETAGAECEVRLADGTVVACRAAAPLAPGAGAIISLRPERIALGAAAQACANRFAARVEDIAYLGDHVRLRLIGAAGIEFSAKLPNRAAFRHGDTLTLGWNAEDARAFPTDEP